MKAKAESDNGGDGVKAASARKYGGEKNGVRQSKIAKWLAANGNINENNGENM
jgi:hypothetical protein